MVTRLEIFGCPLRDVLLLLILLGMAQTLLGCGTIPPGGIDPKANLIGRAMTKSDVATEPDRPLRETLVLAIPSTDLDPLLAAIGMADDRAKELGRLGFRLSEDLFQSYVEASAATGQNGWYALEVPPGDYILCLANLGSSDAVKKLPANVYGCIEVSVSEGERVTQDLFWSMGGVLSR